MLLQVRSLKLDTESWDVELDGKEIKLSFTEFKLLKRLMEEPNKVINPMLILSEWEEEKEHSMGTNIVVVYINMLRKKIPDYIHTVRRAGYKIK